MKFITRTVCVLSLLLTQGCSHLSTVNEFARENSRFEGRERKLTMAFTAAELERLHEMLPSTKPRLLRSSSRGWSKLPEAILSDPPQMVLLCPGRMELSWGSTKYHFLHQTLEIDWVHSADEKAGFIKKLKLEGARVYKISMRRGSEPSLVFYRWYIE